MQQRMLIKCLVFLYTNLYQKKIMYQYRFLIISKEFKENEKFITKFDETPPQENDILRREING